MRSTGTPRGWSAPTPAYCCPPQAGSSFKERTEVPCISQGSPLSEPMVSCRATPYAARLEGASRSIQGVLLAPSATPCHDPFGCPGCQQLPLAPDTARWSRQLQESPTSIQLFLTVHDFCAETQTHACVCVPVRKLHFSQKAKRLTLEMTKGCIELQ